jgi:cytidylate kinase
MSKLEGAVSLQRNLDFIKFETMSEIKHSVDKEADRLEQKISMLQDTISELE